MKRFLIASNFPLFIKGFKEILKENNYDVDESALDGYTALEFIKKNQPSIAILDLRDNRSLTSMEIALECKRLNIPTKIILLVSSPIIDYQSNARKTNILGYLLKESSTLTIKECISSVYNGFPYVSKGIEITNFYETHSKKLTPSEFKIVTLISKNKTTQEIADTLFLSRRTVEKHRSNIIKKLSLPSKNRSLNNWAKKHNYFLK
jgi:DNA-binding NarL/FixJ family response regulator